MRKNGTRRMSMYKSCEGTTCGSPSLAVVCETIHHSLLITLFSLLQDKVPTFHLCLCYLDFASASSSYPPSLSVKVLQHRVIELLILYTPFINNLTQNHGLKCPTFSFAAWSDLRDASSLVCQMPVVIPLLGCLM